MAKEKLTLIAGLYGNTLEWYDFILYANLAPLLSVIFFPTQDPMTSLLLTFAVFATGFLVRPFGALFFGYIGDHFGRRVALITSISIITVPTTLIGFIPSYTHIGIAAPIILTLLRIMQGIAISGELNSAATYVIEHAKPNRRGLAGSLVMGTAFLGILTGALVAFSLTHIFDHDTLMQWGWRTAFWLSGVLGVIGLWIRLKTGESPKFIANHQSPVKTVLTKHRRELLLATLFVMLMAVGNYLFIGYVVSFLVKQGFSLQTATAINLICMLLTIALYPMMGLLSDKIGRKPVYRIGIIGAVIFAFPIFYLLSQPDFWLVLLGDMLLALILAPIAGMVPTIVAEIFTTEVRNSGSAISYNLALAIFGGTTPLVAFKLVELTANPYAPAFYLIFAAVVSGTMLYFIEDKHKENLS